MGLFGRLFGGKKKDEQATDSDAPKPADEPSQPAAEVKPEPAVEEPKPAAVEEPKPVVAEEPKPEPVAEPKPELEPAVVAEAPKTIEEPKPEAGLGSWGSDDSASTGESLGSWGGDESDDAKPIETPAETPEPKSEPAPVPAAVAEPEPVIETVTKSEPAPEPEVKPEPATADTGESLGSWGGDSDNGSLGAWGSTDESSPAPVAEPVPAPVVELAPTPVAEPVPAPVIELAPAPVAEPDPAPVVELAPAPVAEPVPAESEETGSPWGDETAGSQDESPWATVSEPSASASAPAPEPAESSDAIWGETATETTEPVEAQPVAELTPEPAPEPEPAPLPVVVSEPEPQPEPEPVVVSTAGWDDDITGALGLKFKLIKPGRFKMGSPADEPKRNVTLERQITVEITRPYYIGIYPVTQSQWLSMMDMRVMKFKGDNRPVESVSWKNATQFIAKLNKKADGYIYSLPTEAQWEYACRAGTTTAFWNGPSITSDDANILGTVPFPGTKRSKKVGETTDVGSYPPNPWGLYDMHGNVAELCSSFLAQYPETNDVIKDYAGPERGTEYAVRGGGYDIAPHDSRCASREGITEGNHRAYIGFRLVCVKA